MTDKLKKKWKSILRLTIAVCAGIGVAYALLHGLMYPYLHDPMSWYQFACICFLFHLVAIGVATIIIAPASMFPLRLMKKEW